VLKLNVIVYRDIMFTGDAVARKE